MTQSLEIPPPSNWWMYHGDAQHSGRVKYCCGATILAVRPTVIPVGMALVWAQRFGAITSLPAH